MSIEVDPADYGSGPSPARPVLHGLTIAATASIGAGAVHAAATGIHAEHPGLARLFVVCAIAQLGAGLWALVQPRRLAAGAAAVVNVAAVAGWLVTRLTGVSWIGGLETRESPQFADAACAGLGAVAATAALAALLAGYRPGHRPRVILPGLAAAALTIPAMISGGTHVHSHDDTAAGADGHTHTESAATGSTEHGHDGTATGDTSSGDGAATDSTEHTHDDTATGDTATGDTSSGDGAATGSTEHTHDDAAATSTWPRPWDPTQPIDLSGVAGVTPEQEARATELVENTLTDLPRWSDVAAAVADGYASIGDAGTGSEHYIKLSLIQDDVILDPTQPESLVYTVQGDQRILAGAMFIASARPTDDPDLVSWGGPLMQWHNHGNLCWDRDENGVAKVVGLVDATGTCARGVNTGGANPMVHVWITPHPCGVFAALEGVGAGQASVPDDQRADMCHESHDHAGTDSGAGTGASNVSPVPYDPTKPIDLSGVEGVTPEQQAAAENLIAVTIVRLPQWADYHVAEAAGFQSIGDGLTGVEHYVHWDWIDDDVVLDPDHPESLVYEPQPDGTKRLVSAMYMLPTSVSIDEVPDIGGALMQWHIHDNLCYTTDPTAPKVAGLTDADGNCRAGLVKFDPAPMIHVWIVPHECGPFASLEGVGAGQIADGEQRLCDHVHGSTAGG